MFGTRYVPLLCLFLAVFPRFAVCIGPDAYFLGHSLQRAGGGSTTSTSAAVQSSTHSNGYQFESDSSDSYSSDDGVPILRYTSRPGAGLQNTIRNRYPVRNRQQPHHHDATSDSRRNAGPTNRPNEPHNPGFFSTMFDIQSDIPQIDKPSPRYEWEQAKYSTKMAGRVLKDTICDIPATINAARRDRQEGLFNCFESLCNRDAVGAAYYSMTAGAMPCIRFMTAAFTTLNGCAIFFGESVCAGAHLAKVPYRMAQKRIEKCQEAQRLRNEILHSVGPERYEALKSAAEKSQIDHRNACWQISPEERRALHRQHELYTDAYEEKRRRDRDLINFDPSRALDAAGPQRQRYVNRASSYSNALMLHGAY